MPDNSSYLVVPSAALWLSILAIVGILCIALAVVVSRALRARNTKRASLEPGPVRGPLPEFEKNGQSATAALVQWSPETLR
ncbi:MAG: trehalose-6-phosphate synthase, partial [Mesorhizobium sp.]